MFALYAAVYRGAIVTAFEPAASTYATLVKNVVANKLDAQVRALCAAIDDRCHIADMRMRDDVPGSALHLFGTDVDYTGATITPAFLQGAIGVSIDDLCSRFGLDVPHYVKIDVDGLERAVIAGGRETFSHPTCRSVLVELDLNDATEVRDITDAMRACGLTRDDGVPHNTARAHPNALVYNMVFRR